MPRSSSRHAVLHLIAALGALLPPGAAAAEELFKGRTVSIVVGYVAGGGYDLAARLVAQHWGRHIPGHPQIIVQNMPGGSSVVAANYLYNVAPKDGTAVGALGSIIVAAKVLRQPAKYEPEKFLWIGRLDAGDAVCITWHTSGVRTIADAKAKAIPMAGGTSMGPAVMGPIALNKLLSTQFQIVRGYTGSATMVAAMEKGEAAGTATFGLNALLYTRPHWLREGLVNILYLVALERNPAIPHVPTMLELAENDEQRAIFNVLTSEPVIGRNFTAPPGLPPERAVALRRAFDSLVRDPVFLDDLKSKDFVISPWSGERLEEYVRSVVSIDPKVVERAIWATTSD